MIADQILARRQQARAEAAVAYWQAVRAFADDAPDLPSLDSLEAVLTTLGVAPGDLDFDVARVRVVRSVRANVNLAAAQANLAAVQQLRDEAAAAEFAAVNARVAADQAARAAKDGDAAARRDVERAFAELKRGDTLRGELLERGCPAELAGEPCYVPPPPPPMRRWRALETLYVGDALRKRGDVFDSSDEFPRHLAQPVGADAVSETLKRPFRVTQRLSLRQHGSPVDTVHEPGEVVWLDGDITIGVVGPQLEPLTLEAAAELERERAEALDAIARAVSPAKAPAATVPPPQLTAAQAAELDAALRKEAGMAPAADA